MWTFMGPAGPTGVPGPVLPSASVYWIKITNSTWPLKTQTVKITSQRSSLSMASGKISLLETYWDLSPLPWSIHWLYSILTFSWFHFHLQYSEENRTNRIPTISQTWHSAYRNGSPRGGLPALCTLQILPSCWPIWGSSTTGKVPSSAWSKWWPL